MNIDRERFVLLVAALSACHTAPSREPNAAAAPSAGTAPAPGASAEPSAGTGATAKLVTVDIGKAESAPVAMNDDTDAGSDGASPSGSRRYPSLPHACAALEHEGEYCDDEDRRRQMCANVVGEFRPAVARDAVQCLTGLSSSCDNCGIRQCAKTALERAWAARSRSVQPQLAGCEPVRAKAEQELGDGTEYAELCTRYAFGMNDKGRRRFTRCLVDSVGVGIRYCLWDPSTTPCTEGNGSPSRPGGPTPGF